LPQKYSRQRKVPARLKKTSKSAREDDEVLTSEEYYRGRTYYTFLDRLRQELERRFYRKGKTRDIVMSLQRLSGSSGRILANVLIQHIHYVSFIDFRGKRPTFKQS